MEKIDPLLPELPRPAALPGRGRFLNGSPGSARRRKRAVGAHSKVINTADRSLTRTSPFCPAPNHSRAYLLQPRGTVSPRASENRLPEGPAHLSGSGPRQSPSLGSRAQHWPQQLSEGLREDIFYRTGWRITCKNGGKPVLSILGWGFDFSRSLASLHRRQLQCGIWADDPLAGLYS